MRGAGLPIRQDVALDPLEDPEPLALRVERIDLGVLRHNGVLLEATGIGRRLRMIREAEILEAELLRRAHHLLDRGLPVAPGRVHVKHALQILQLHELGYLPCRGCGDLARVLAKLRRNVGEAEDLEKIFLALTPHRPAPLPQAVLVELVSLLLRERADSNVMRLGAGEIVQREGELQGFHHPEIHLEARREHHASLGVARREHALHAGELGEALHDLLGLVRRHEKIGVVHHLLLATQRPAHFHALHHRELGQGRRERVGLLPRLGPEKAPGVLLHELDSLENLRLALLAESGESDEPVLLAGVLKLTHRLHAELLVQHLHLLGAHVGDLKHVEEAGRDRGAQLLMVREAARRDERRDLLGDRLPDSLHLA